MKIVNLIEASYRGNLGAMEMFKFHNMATPKQKEIMKRLLNSGKHAAAWKYLQRVTGVTLT